MKQQIQLSFWTKRNLMKPTSVFIHKKTRILGF